MTPNSDKKSPKIGAAQIRLLERLTQACAVSGDEGEVRAIVLEHIRPVADDVRVDALGNVLATRRGQVEPRLRVLLTAHMDEVGFILTHDEDTGKGLTGFWRKNGSICDDAKVFYLFLKLARDQRK